MSAVRVLVPDTSLRVQVTGMLLTSRFLDNFVCAFSFVFPHSCLSLFFVFFFERFDNRPTDRSVVVIFIIGGFTPVELKEVNAVLHCCAASADERVPEVILAGTTLSTPDMVYEQVFGRPPACQQ